MIFNNKHIIKILLTIVYFLVLALYNLFVYYDLEPYRFILGFSRIPILCLLYLLISNKRDFIYILALFFFQLSFLYFKKETSFDLFLGAFFSVCYKLASLIIIFKIIMEVEWKKVLLYAIPIFLIYIYMINLVEDILEESKYLWLLNGILTSLIGGLAITNYYKDDHNSGYWLLITALFFVFQVAVFFINKFYLKQETLIHIVILMYGFSHYTFFRFITLNEESA